MVFRLNFSGFVFFYGIPDSSVIVLYLIQPRALINTHHNTQPSAQCPKPTFLFDINNTKWPRPTFLFFFSSSPFLSQTIPFLFQKETELYKLANWMNPLVQRSEDTLDTLKNTVSVSSTTPISHYNTLNIPHNCSHTANRCTQFAFSYKSQPK